MAALVDDAQASSPAARPTSRRSFRRCGRRAFSARCGADRHQPLARTIRSTTPCLEGAYIAASISPRRPIATRFRATFNYDADVNVAYAYDMVALTAGIASAVGPKGLTRKVLENQTGFRGSTGLFRFRSDGASKRSMPFYQVKNGALKQIEKSISGF